jgi:hypothetical protein
MVIYVLVSEEPAVSIFKAEILKELKHLNVAT